MTRTGLFRIWLGALATLLILGGGVPSSVVSADRIRMQILTDPDGYGRILINTAGGPWTWEACQPSLDRCVPFGRGREIDTKKAAPGTIFRVSGSGSSSLSPRWDGRVSRVRLPGAGGLVRGNEFVSPVGAVWRGGWKGEYSEFQLAACDSPTGVNCVSLTDPRYERECAARSAAIVLDPMYAGRYLRIADRRVGAGPLIRPASAVLSPNGDEIWGRDRATAVAVVGQIAAPVSAYPGECGPPPPAQGSISSRGVATVRCQAGCQAELVARAGGATRRVVRRLPEQDILVLAPPTELSVRGGLPQGRVRLVLQIDGRKLAQRTVPAVQHGQ